MCWDLDAGSLNYAGAKYAFDPEGKFLAVCGVRYEGPEGEGAVRAGLFEVPGGRRAWEVTIADRRGSRFSVRGLAVDPRGEWVALSFSL